MLTFFYNRTGSYSYSMAVNIEVFNNVFNIDLSV